MSVSPNSLTLTSMEIIVEGGKTFQIDENINYSQFIIAVFHLLPIILILILNTQGTINLL